MVPLCHTHPGCVIMWVVTATGTLHHAFLTWWAKISWSHEPRQTFLFYQYCRHSDGTVVNATLLWVMWVSVDLEIVLSLCSCWWPLRHETQFFLGLKEHKKRCITILASYRVLNTSKAQERQASPRIQTPAYFSLALLYPSLCIGQKSCICWGLSYTAHRKTLSAACLLEGWAKNKEHTVIDLEARGTTEWYPGKKDQPLWKETLPVW